MASPSDFHGVVWADVQGLSETSKALGDIATKFPQLFRKALAAEVSNIKKSIAATLKNYKILKAVPVPNLVEATAWRGHNLAKKSAVTKALTGNKRVSAIAKPASVRVESIPGGFEVGHFGGLSKYAVRFQVGVPRHVDNKGTRHWMYTKLGPKMNVHTYEDLMATIAPVSPPRPYINVLARKVGAQFIPGLAKLLDVVAQREMKKAGCNQNDSKGNSN